MLGHTARRVTESGVLLWRSTAQWHVNIFWRDFSHLNEVSNLSTSSNFLGQNNILKFEIFFTCTTYFLSLMDGAYTTDFTHARVTNPALQFRDCFTYFIGRYGATNETERSENRERMKAPWTLQEGWERLQKQIDDGHIYSLFVTHPIQDSDLVDCAITVIGQTGLFTTQYEQWHERADGDKKCQNAHSTSKRESAMEG